MGDHYIIRFYINREILETSYVCITVMQLQHVCVKQYVLPLPAVSLGDWFSVSRKGGTGGGGLVYTPKG